MQCKLLFLFIGPLQRERGISLLMAILLGLILTSIGFVTIHAVITDASVSGYHIKTVQAFWAAESGMEKALNYLRFADPPPGGTAPFTYEQDAPVGGGSYTTEIDPDDGNAGTYLKKYRITVTGKMGDATRTITAQVQSSTFGAYAYLTADEGMGTIWFTSGDLIDGPIHSNDFIAISGSPTFTGKVTSARDKFIEGPNFSPDFQKGYQLGVPEVTFPTLQNILDNYLLENGSTTPLTIDARFNRDAEIVFNADGTMNYSVWRYTWGGGKVYIIENQSVALSDLNGMVYVKGDVSVKGEVNGRITLIASDNIYIEDDIVYYDSDAEGKPNPSSSSALGLISVKNVVIEDNQPNSNDIRINGAILTIEKSMTVNNYASGQPRGKLRLWGSLSQRIRGPVGTYNNWGTRSGYEKDYHYDYRFLNSPPPYFPVTGQYEIFSWQEVDE